MSISLESLVSSKTLHAVRTHGLHKIAGIVSGMSGPVTLKKAVARIGARAYLQKKEAEVIAAGIRAFAQESGVKEGGAWEAILRKSLPAAALTAGASIVPDLMSSQPVSQEQMVQHALLGGALGGVAGAGHTLNKAFRDPHLEELLARTVGQG